MKFLLHFLCKVKQAPHLSQVCKENGFPLVGRGFRKEQRGPLGLSVTEPWHCHSSLASILGESFQSPQYRVLRPQCQSFLEAGWVRMDGQLKMQDPKGMAKAAFTQAILGAPGSEKSGEEMSTSSDSKCQVIAWGQESNTSLCLQVSSSFPLGSWDTGRWFQPSAQEGWPDLSEESGPWQMSSLSYRTEIFILFVPWTFWQFGDKTKLWSLSQNNILNA